jgi:hypothetical protein
MLLRTDCTCLPERSGNLKPQSTKGVGRLKRRQWAANKMATGRLEPDPGQGGWGRRPSTLRRRARCLRILISRGWTPPAQPPIRFN